MPQSTQSRLTASRTLQQRLLPHQCSITMIAIALVMCHFTSTAVGDATSQKTNENQTATNSSNSSDEHDADESPQLGVIIGSCPGQGVCVLDTVWGSPADEAGMLHSNCCGSST